MRIIQCDVCDKNFDPREAELAELSVPPSWTDGDGLLLDVCSPTCLQDAATALQRTQADVEDEPRQLKITRSGVVEEPVIPPENDGQIGISAMPQPKYVPMTDEQIEAVTGVKRRGQG